MNLLPLLESTLAARMALLDPKHDSAVRLFHGFAEGAPELSVECFGRTLVINDYREQPYAPSDMVATALSFYREQLPWLTTGLLKTRAASEPAARNGRLLFGETLDRRIREQGVAYALDLALNRDAGFYLDTRALRAWAKANLGGATVLNTFAYTGSLGVAARAGGAARVVHLDLNRHFLNLAKTSYTLNGFAIEKRDFRAIDFFVAAARMRRADERFDCVILDPPLFSSTTAGEVDLMGETARLINKARPLVADGGTLVAVNNALFLSGAEYLATLEELCADGYLRIEALLPVPEDCTGYPHTIVRPPPSDPAPFNHATKMVVLRVRRKAG